MIALYRAEPSGEWDLMQSHQPLAIIAQSDFNALWREVGIDVDSWSPDVRHQAEGFKYPRIYAIQNYIVYEHQCSVGEVSALLAETVQLKDTIQSSESKRVLETLFSAASSMVSEERGIVFRASLAESQR
jgi:hypothetical protein